MSNTNTIHQNWSEYASRIFILEGLREKLEEAGIWAMDRLETVNHMLDTERAILKLIDQEMEHWVDDSTLNSWIFEHYGEGR